ncbi:Ornithine decarboxylase [Thelohanellus kitauei]|uniref:Ornithine decarboxylase n=1 Tax=Thelohanellus kitauei TaxID=669202 RepID=A0A0C2N0P4_THEKT|nr:Ornithine decarboxylase [Thelohanellus kitauei]
MLASLKLGFHCASRSEITQALETGVPAERIIYATPCKQVSHLEFAKTCNVKTMTLESSDELVKIKNTFPKALLIQRIFLGSKNGLGQFGRKFRARTSNIRHLLKRAICLNLNVIGASFHFGPGCFDPLAYSDAIFLASEILKLAEGMGIIVSLLDIGGGFPGYFDSENSSNVRIIAESGRKYVSSAFQLVWTVTSIRSNIDGSDENGYGYFLNDGVFGSFNCAVSNHYIGMHYLLDDIESKSNELIFPSVLYGPTCHSFDKLLD